MGFESKISGFISVNRNSSTYKETIELINKAIGDLPQLKDDSFPFLPREIFGVSLVNPDENIIPIAYGYIMIHFGISMKQVDEEIEIWLEKYERFLKSIPEAWESIVLIQLIPYTANYKMQHLSYHWYKEYIPKTYDSFWKFEGDPTKWSDLVESKFQPIENKL